LSWRVCPFGCNLTRPSFAIPLVMSRSNMRNPLGLAIDSCASYPPSIGARRHRGVTQHPGPRQVNKLGTFSIEECSLFLDGLQRDLLSRSHSSAEHLKSIEWLSGTMQRNSVPVWNASDLLSVPWLSHRTRSTWTSRWSCGFSRKKDCWQWQKSARLSQQNSSEGRVRVLPFQDDLNEFAQKEETRQEEESNTAEHMEKIRKRCGL
jgi:hypothetical protein